MKFNLLHKRSIKTRVTLFTLLIFVISLWALSFYASRMLKVDMQHLAGEQQFTTAHFVAGKVNEQLTDRLAALDGVATMVDNSMLNSPKALQIFLEQRPSLNILFNAGTYFTDINGTALASLPVSLGRVGVNYMERDHVVSALKDGKARIGTPVIGKLLKTPVFSMAVPMRNAQGQVIGAMVGVIDLSRPNFLDTVTNNRYGQSGGYLLIDSKARLIITATDKRRILEVLVPGFNPLADRFILGYEGSGLAVNPLGVEVLASGNNIPVANWHIVVWVPTTEAFAPIRDMQQRMLLATLTLTLLAGVLTWWMLRRELTPLLDAAQALSGVPASGQLAKPLPVVRHDEVGALIGSFNSLIETVALREQDLRNSETRLTAILNDTKMHLWLFDGNNITFVNKQWFDFTGQDPGAELTFALWASVMHPDDLKQTTKTWLKHLKAKTEHDNYFRLRRHDGVYRDFHSHVLPVFDEQGTFRYFQGFEIDITESKRAGQLEKFRSQALELMAGDAPLERVLQALVLGVQKVKPEMICSVLQLSADGKHLGQGVAPGLPDFYNAAVDGLEIGIGVGSCGTAAYTGKRVIVENIQTHPYWAPYKELAAQAGLGACWSEPIRAAANQVLGTFAIYHRVPNTPDAADLHLIEQSASLASIAIEKHCAANALRLSEQRLELAVIGAKEGIWDLDLLTGELYHSPQMALMLGYTETELPPKREVWDALTEPQDKANFAAEMGKHFKNPSHVFDVLVRLRHKDGRWRWVQSRGQATRNAQGRAVRFSGMQVDVTERKQLEEQVRQLAFFDALTGLPNRRMLDDRLHQVIAASKRSGLYGALMFLDLDNFKPLNDTHGHEVGDLLLVEVAQRLNACLREVDTVARFGGDEFVVMLSELGADKTVSSEQATGVAEKIRVSLAAPYRLTVVQPGQQDKTVEHHCSASIGVVMFINHEASQNEVMKWADAAMYQAKSTGRNRVSFYAA